MAQSVQQGPGLRTFGTLARLALRSAVSRLRSGSRPDLTLEDRFEATMERLAHVPSAAAEIRQFRLLELEAKATGWEDVGLHVESGAQVTVLATGALWASKALGLRFGARIGLWLRAGTEGRILKTPGDAATVRLEQGGPLAIVAKPPGEWANDRGEFDPAFPRAGITGALKVCVIVWKGDAEAGLKAMLHEGDHGGLVGRALDELRHPVQIPQGWSYLWRLGQGAIYSDAGDGHGRHIHCHTKEDVGILQFPADFPLTADTRLKWRWKVDKLPCDLPEDIQPTHDYLSIAVEFDNGQDLTYMWSASLAEDTIFRCPLPFWDKVETHWVLRSNPDKLGRWLTEDRPVQADYARAVGDPPQRIVRVWLIAVSVFQRGEGICDYADIELVDGDRVLKVS